LKPLRPPNCSATAPAAVARRQRGGGRSIPGGVQSRAEPEEHWDGFPEQSQRRMDLCFLGVSQLSDQDDAPWHCPLRQLRRLPEPRPQPAAGVRHAGRTGFTFQLLTPFPSISIHLETETRLSLKSSHPHRSLKTLLLPPITPPATPLH